MKYSEIGILLTTSRRGSDRAYTGPLIETKVEVNWITAHNNSWCVTKERSHERYESAEDIETFLCKNGT
jgi:hypothetical protein